MKTDISEIDGIKLKKIKFEKKVRTLGLEPWSPAWQAGILTTVLVWLKDVSRFLIHNVKLSELWVIVWRLSIFSTTIRDRQNSSRDLGQFFAVVRFS